MRLLHCSLHRPEAATEEQPYLSPYATHDHRAATHNGNDGERDEASCRCVGSGTASVTFEVIAMDGGGGARRVCVCVVGCVFLVRAPEGLVQHGLYQCH